MSSLFSRFRPLKRNVGHSAKQWSGTLRNGVYIVVTYCPGDATYKEINPWEVEVTSAPTPIHGRRHTRLLYYATPREVRQCIRRSGRVKAGPANPRPFGWLSKP